MIEGLKSLLENKNQQGIVELQAVLQDLLGKDVNGRLLAEEKLLRSRVYRLKFEIEGSVKSFVVKRLSPAKGQLERTAVERWLPHAGLETSAPPLIAAAAEKTGKCIWHIYDDLGDCSLTNYLQDTAIVREAIKLLARVHTSFVDHVFLSECRLLGENYDINFFSTCVKEAYRTLEIAKRNTDDGHTIGLSIIDSLLQRLSKLYDNRAFYEVVMKEYNGPETLLHGDLWTTNFLIQRNSDNIHILLIDWDHIGAGPIYYDLSTFLMRFELKDRAGIVDLYQEAIGFTNWQLPGFEILNALFETSEYARLANATIWPAIAAAESQAEWAFDGLKEIDGWFEDMQPVLPVI